jgi:hypothetical protein
VGYRSSGGQTGGGVVLAVLCALSHARLPHRDFAFGGKHWGKTFELDEHDRLAELVPE